MISSSSTHAYTPGLKRKEICLIRRTRRLPLLGQVLVREGQLVFPDSVVAVTDVPGAPRAVNVAYTLGLEPEEVERCLLVTEGETVRKNNPLALYESLFGLYKKQCLSPIDGTMEHYSKVSGQAIVRGLPVRVEVNAYIRGNVAKVLPSEGVVVETAGAMIQGIFGIGGETHGELMVVVEGGSDVLDSQHLGPDCRNKVLVGGSIVDADTLHKAAKEGAKAVITGGIRSQDLDKFLGYEVGVAITGEEEADLTLVVTEGFGKMAMSEKTFDMLKKFEGRLACVNGATQIRAGVIRPEIIVPREEVSVDEATSLEKEIGYSAGVNLGVLVRIIRAPYFGEVGTVAGLPPELRRLQSGSSARVLAVKLEKGQTVVVPRANVEIIE